MEDDELHTRKLQVSEMARVIQVESDFEFAFQLQLQAAMEVSESMSASDASVEYTSTQVLSLACLRSTPSDSLSITLDSPGEEVAQATIDRDRQIAVKQQEEELERLEQEIAGLEEARRMQCMSQEILAISNHDAKFARFLNAVPQVNWMKDGELLADPFVVTAKANKEVPCNARSQCTTGKAVVIKEVACDAARQPTKGKSQVMEEVAYDAAYQCTKGKSIVIEEDIYSAPFYSTKKIAVDVGSSLESTAYPTDIWEPALAAAFMLRTEGNENYSYGPAVNQRREFGTTPTVEAGQDDKSGTDDLPKFFCEICWELKKTPENAQYVAMCNHQYCLECLERHGENEVKMGKSYINCPHLGCEVLWSMQQCTILLSIMSCQILVQRQVENAIPELERVYCPYPDCSMLQIKPSPEWQYQPSSSKYPPAIPVVSVECGGCNRLFCLECQVSWHVDLSCEEFQLLAETERSPEDVHLAGLAKLKKWQRCKNCKYMVELKSGCCHITCRCGSEFCYVCGGNWSHDHSCKS